MRTFLTILGLYLLSGPIEFLLVMALVGIGALKTKLRSMKTKPEKVRARSTNDELGTEIVESAGD